MRYLATVSYVGTNYAGWQVQPDANSIQAELELVISRVLNTPTKIFGSGRTDAGVHALGQTFHFDSKKIEDLEKFRYSLNCLLKDDIHINKIKSVRSDFHARYDVKEKVYSYFINMDEANPFEKDRVYNLMRKLDTKKMKEALLFFKGRHDFRNFTTKESDDNHFIREIYDASLIKDGDKIQLTFKGDGFMRYMVRIIVGTLVEVGLGKIEPMEISKLLTPTSRHIVSYKAPACGLYLEKVIY